MTRARAGYTVLELMVVIAILIAAVAVSIPALSSILALEQRRVARDLVLTYEMLHDEAVLRNVTFRIAYHLDGGYYVVEAGDPTTLIFDDPELREDYEKELLDKLSRHSDEAREEAMASQPRFETIKTFAGTRIDLPNGTRFGGVYTPQYDELVEPTGEEEDPEHPLITYSYVFPNGFAEPTVVQMVKTRNEDDGYTVVVEPLSGRVTLRTEVVDPRDAFADVPQQGPGLP